MAKYFRKNYQIRVPKVVLIDEEGHHLGIVNTADALNQAREKGVDLVEVAPLANPPVCKMVNFGKFKYLQEKAEKKSRLKARKVELKNIRLTLKIGEHDIAVRANQSKKFLDKGDKVRLEMILRGREMAHQDLAREKINKFIQSLGDDISIEQPLKRQGNNFSVIINKNK